ncbi:MAG: hypothetical protein NHG36_08665, partial [Chromatiaceae bacterium]|nr:hypothetical protein [Candidatus Thioaporhodococcus sediminis]
GGLSADLGQGGQAARRVARPAFGGAAPAVGALCAFLGAGQSAIEGVDPLVGTGDFGCIGLDPLACGLQVSRYGVELLAGVGQAGLGSVDAAAEFEG